MMRRLCPAVLTLLVLAAAAARAADTNAAARLHGLFQREWERTMRENPTWASTLGDRRYNDRWADLSSAGFERRQADDRAALTELKSLDRAALPPREQLNYDLFEREYATRVAGFPFALHLLPVDQRGGLQTDDDLASALRFETLKDFEDWVARLRGFGAYADQTMDLLREGVRRGVVQPRGTMQRVPAQIEKQLTDDPAKSPFYKPLLTFPAEVAAADRERLRGEAQAAIREVVTPAYRRFQQFFTDEYLLACRAEPGVWALKDGANRYGYLARLFTTTGLTAKEIHETGLREVARIRAEMEKAKVESGFNGTLAEFFHFLRTDPQFFCKTPLELLATYQVVSKRIDPTLVKLFRTMPRTPYGVEPIPDKIAPDTTTAYYRQPAADGSRAGTYFVNLFRPEVRPKWEMMALSIHEAVPGHHFQIALAQEQGALPDFRKHAEYTAFVEGWALYAESLGYELGLYATPYDRMGQLTYEMWRAVRLVVDTGLHAFQWDRQRAIDFFKENAPKTEQDIVNEIDRYISWPGQALAYKVGELKIKELRARATEALGERFDIKEFHDVVLLPGAVPLDLLEQNVNAWIALKRGQG
ncbi:MAG: DUF885 domain-containing protein [Limisphaerales bacterium]